MMKKGVRMKNNDPRLLKAVAAKKERPRMRPYDAFIAGGFLLQGKSKKCIINLQAWCLGIQEDAP